MKTIIELIERHAHKIADFFSLWVVILRDPLAFVRTKEIDSDAEIGRSFLFLLCVSLFVMVILIPVDVFYKRIDLSNHFKAISLFLGYVINPVVFAVLLYLISKMFFGKNRFGATLVALFYGSAYLPVVFVTQYVTRAGPETTRFILGLENKTSEILRAMQSGTLAQGQGPLEAVLSHFPPTIIVYAVIELAALIFILCRLTPVVAWTMQASKTRAVLVFMLTGVVHSIVSLQFNAPLLRQISDLAAD